MKVTPSWRCCRKNIISASCVLPSMPEEEDSWWRWVPFLGPFALEAFETEYIACMSLSLSDKAPVGICFEGILRHCCVYNALHHILSNLLEERDSHCRQWVAMLGLMCENHQFLDAFLYCWWGHIFLGVFSYVCVKLVLFIMLEETVNGGWARIMGSAFETQNTTCDYVFDTL